MDETASATAASYHEHINNRLDNWFLVNKHHFGAIDLNMDAVTSIAFLCGEFNAQLTGPQMIVLHGMLSPLWEDSRELAAIKASK